MEVLFGTDARFKGKFLNDMLDIAEIIKLEPGADGTPPAFANLKQGILENVRSSSRNRWETAKLTDWETFSYLAEFLSKPENLRSIEKAEGFTKLKNLVDTSVSGKTGVKYDLTQKADIVRFFGDYVNTIRKGDNALGMLKHLEQVIAEPNSPEMREMQR